MSKLLLQTFHQSSDNPGLFLAAGMLGAIAPDFDMFYFFFVDQMQHHHHTYWPHFPIVWFSLLLLALGWYGLAKEKANASYALIFSLAGCLHMLLDSIVGDIWWLAPFVDQSFALFSVTARYSPWWLNFILHWSFVLELMLVLGALLLWRGRQLKTQ